MRLILRQLIYLTRLLSCFLAVASAAALTPLAAAPPPKGQNNVWHRNAHSDIVIVFIHGFLSDSTRSWQSNENHAYWPDLLLEDPFFDRSDVFLGGFYTSPVSQQYDVIEASKSLFDELNRSLHAETSVLDRPYVFFVTHSTGGIVARHLLYHNSQRFEDKVVGLALFASPSYGSVHATRFEGIFRALNTERGLQLRHNSDFLKNLDSDFRRLLDLKRIPHLIGREFVETHFVLGSFTSAPLPAILGDAFGPLLVPRESAVGYFDYRLLPNTDHFQIVKPTSLSHPSHIQLRDAYSSFLTKIDALERQRKLRIAAIYADLKTARQNLNAGQYETARHQIDSAKQACNEVNDRACSGYAEFYEGRLALAQSNFQKAHSLYRNAEEHFEVSSEFRGIGNVKVELAELARLDENFELALVQLEEARILFEKEGDFAGSARAGVVMGHVFAMQGESARAGKAFEYALDVFQDSPDGIFQARARVGLARIKLAAGETHAAMTLLEDATFDCQRSENWACGENVGVAKATAYFQTGQRQRARDSLQGARAIFLHMGRPYDLAISYMVEGDGIAGEEPEQAIEAFKKAARLFKEARRADFAILAEQRIQRLSGTSR